MKVFPSSRTERRIWDQFRTPHSCDDIRSGIRLRDWIGIWIVLQGVWDLGLNSSVVFNRIGFDLRRKERISFFSEHEEWRDDMLVLLHFCSSNNPSHSLQLQTFPTIIQFNSTRGEYNRRSNASMPSGHIDVAWGDIGGSIHEESLSSNIDSTSGRDITYRDFPVSNDPLLKDCTYQQLLSEISRRNLDIQEEVTFDLVKQTYRIEKQLGKGSSGVVHLAHHKLSHEKFACKVIEKKGPVNDILSMTTEVEIMKRVRHPRVISMCELYESPKCMWMILELVEAGGLRSKLQLLHKRFNEKIAVRLVKQILEGLQYLHNQGVVHRDIKIDNILFQGDVRTGSIKIADFGLSALIKGEEMGYPSDPIRRKKFRCKKSI